MGTEAESGEDAKLKGQLVDDEGEARVRRGVVVRASARPISILRCVTDYKIEAL